MSGITKAARNVTKAAPVDAPAIESTTKRTKAAPKAAPAPVETKPAPVVKIVRAGVTKPATTPKAAPAPVVQVTTKAAPKRSPKAVDAPAPVVTAPKSPKAAPAPKSTPKAAPVVQVTPSTTKAAPKLPNNRKSTKLTGGTSVGSAKPASKAAPVALKPRVKGFKPYSASTLYEQHKSVPVDANATPLGWENGRVDWTKAAYHLAIYSRAGAKPSDLQYPADTYFRTVAWGHVADAMGFVDALVKLNTPKVMKSGAVKVSIYRNGTLVAQNDSGVWTMKPVTKAAPAPKAAPKSTTKAAPAPKAEPPKAAPKRSPKAAPVVTAPAPVASTKRTTKAAPAPAPKAAPKRTK